MKLNCFLKINIFTVMVVLLQGCGSQRYEPSLTHEAQYYKYDDVSILDIIKTDYKPIDTKNAIPYSDILKAYDGNSGLEGLMEKVRVVNKDVKIEPISEIKVIHGDSVEVVTKKGETLNIDLAGVKSINTNDRYSKPSIKNLQNCVGDFKHAYVVYDKSKWSQKTHNTFGKIISNGVDCNYEQIKTGNAKFDRRNIRALFDYELDIFGSAEYKAQDAKLGVWEELYPSEPPQDEMAFVKESFQKLKPIKTPTEEMQLVKHTYDYLTTK